MTEIFALALVGSLLLNLVLYRRPPRRVVEKIEVEFRPPTKEEMEVAKKNVTDIVRRMERVGRRRGADKKAYAMRSLLRRHPTLDPNEASRIIELAVRGVKSS